MRVPTAVGESFVSQNGWNQMAAIGESSSSACSHQETRFAIQPTLAKITTTATADRTSGMSRFSRSLSFALLIILSFITNPELCRQKNRAGKAGEAKPGAARDACSWCPCGRASNRLELSCSDRAGRNQVFATALFEFFRTSTDLTRNRS